MGRGIAVMLAGCRVEAVAFGALLVELQGLLRRREEKSKGGEL
jgi:hypothetical protein